MGHKVQQEVPSEHQKALLYSVVNVALARVARRDSGVSHFGGLKPPGLFSGQTAIPITIPKLPIAGGGGPDNLQRFLPVSTIQ